MSDIKKQVGTIIREARKSKGLTQTELAKRLEVQRAVVNKFEVGDQNVTVLSLQKVADALSMVLKISLENPEK